MSTKTFSIVTHKEDGTEEATELQGTRAEFDAQSQRLTIYDGDEPVGGFIRIVRWHRKS